MRKTCDCLKRMFFDITLLWTAITVGLFYAVETIVGKLWPHITYGRKRYIAKNISKSVLLSLISVFSTKAIWTFFIDGTPNNEVIGTMGLMYAIPDIYALWWMPSEMLAPSTVRHHRVVGIFAFMNLFHDYSIPSHWDALVMYAYLSTLTGIVNFYLGSRFLLNRENTTQDKYRTKLAFTSLFIYVTSCLFNWTYQLNTVFRGLHLNSLDLKMALDTVTIDLTYRNFVGYLKALIPVLSFLSYGIMLFFIIQDDLLLMRKLYDDRKRFVGGKKRSFRIDDVDVTVSF